MQKELYSLKETKDFLRQKHYKVMLIGDGCYDIYHYGSVNRISPEAPVPVFDHKYSKKKFGMALNVKENLTSLGMNEYTDIHVYAYPLEEKNRYLHEKTNQQLFRVDNKITQPDGLFFIMKIVELFIKDVDCVVISDYDKGTLSLDDIVKIISLAKEHDIPVFIDTKKKDYACLSGAFVKINEKEYMERKYGKKFQM